MRTLITCGFNQERMQLVQPDYRIFHYEKARQINQEILFNSSFLVLIFNEPKLNENRLNEILSFQFYFREAHIIIVADPKNLSFTAHYKDHPFLFFFPPNELSQVRRLFKRFEKETVSAKRDTVRVKIELSAELRTQVLISLFPKKTKQSDPTKAWIYDISDSGVSAIVTHPNLTTGQFIYLKIQLPDRTTAAIEGQIKWIQPSQGHTFKVGLQMVNPINLVSLIFKSAQKKSSKPTPKAG